MKNKLLLLIITCLIISKVDYALAQPCSDYPCVIIKVKKAIDAKNYKLAFEQLESAEGYPNKNTLEITELRKKLFNLIEKEKTDAEEARDKAKKLTEQAEVAKNDALDQKRIAMEALQKVKEANAKVVDSYCKDIDDLILTLHYNAAFEKCKNAYLLNESRESVLERLYELAYYYTEADMSTAAIAVLQVIDPYFSLTTKDTLNKLKAYLQKSMPAKLYELFEKRYYPNMIPIEGDTFTMGNTDVNSNDGKPLHRVQISSFRMAETETTVWQYFLFVKAANRKEPAAPCFQWEGYKPVVEVSWDDANAYIEWLKGQSNRKYRLQTDAEWEYAAKGGIHHQESDYSGSKIINAVAWYYGNSDSRTHPVRRLEGNALGLYDMTGNAWEWCSDWYDENYYQKCFDNGIVANPQGPSKGDSRVLRGGSWSKTEYFCRVSYHLSSPPSAAIDGAGFRVAEDSSN